MALGLMARLRMAAVVGVWARTGFAAAVEARERAAEVARKGLSRGIFSDTKLVCQRGRCVLAFLGRLPDAVGAASAATGSRRVPAGG